MTEDSKKAEEKNFIDQDRRLFDRTRAALRVEAFSQSAQQKLFLGLIANLNFFNGIGFPTLISSIKPLKIGNISEFYERTYYRNSDHSSRGLQVSRTQ